MWNGPEKLAQLLFEHAVGVEIERLHDGGGMRGQEDDLDVMISPNLVDIEAFMNLGAIDEEQGWFGGRETLDESDSADLRDKAVVDPFVK